MKCGKHDKPNTQLLCIATNTMAMHSFFLYMLCLKSQTSNVNQIHRFHFSFCTFWPMFIYQTWPKNKTELFSAQTTTNITSIPISLSTFIFVVVVVVSYFDGVSISCMVCLFQEIHILNCVCFFFYLFKRFEYLNTFIVNSRIFVHGSRHKIYKTASVDIDFNEIKQQQGK